ncbi:acyltransferase family protein [Sphingopyxis macrogoltabida]|uniref:Acyltransferase n=1 Tax=Sphingopyxis macrogoltabida TaxID=33050 RepID=A0AAC9FGT9_SPHMC|nr:acyltransferase family protein [Sphingopyxis macrogoltabida]ALJ15657.1 hypothetical protein LH19_22515 [Sphingopyxis macrogoltabida]AMU91898.1 hypothetical protein ATM17_23075 [Sphingopyxis macrogoltabida]
MNGTIRSVIATEWARIFLTFLSANPVGCHFAQGKIMGEYRGDIQIFRALAVTLVLLFHLGIAGLPSGFLGVDIFFVISGYLMQKLHRNDHSAVSFYQRRARRLLPAYFATIFFTLIAAYWVTLPIDFAQTAHQAAFASIFSSNIGYWLQNSYFSKDNFNPLLHLWSLAVEVQFYIAFPLIAWLCRDRRWLLVGIALASFALCLVVLTVSPKTAFFMVPTRLWQFAIGMFAATWSGPADKRVGAASLAAMTVIPLIALGVDARDILYGHPGAAALAISGATAVALANPLDRRFVESAIGRALQRLGNISYSLYLAHWPVLVLLHYRPFGGTITGGGSVALFLVSLVLIGAAALALYGCFERPGPKIYTAKRAVLVATTLAGTAILAPSLQQTRFSGEQRQIFAGATDRSTYRCGKMFRIESPGESLCAIGKGEKTVLLIGDSHSDSIKQTFAKTASQNGFATYFSVDNTPLISGGNDADWLVHEAERKNADRVYLHFAPKNLNPAIILDAAHRLRSAGVQTVLIAPVPIYSGNVLVSLYDHDAHGKPLPRQTLVEYDKLNRAKLDAIGNGGVPIIEVAATMCDPVCRLTDANGDPAYFDDTHLTLSGARMIERLLNQDFEARR